MESPPTIKQMMTEFILQQQSVGISLQTFKKKFVFNQNSGPDTIFIDIHTPSPSQLIGMTQKQQNACIYIMSQMVFKAGEMLKLPISTTIVALNIIQYYYTRKSFLDYDFRDICLGAMFLACKSEQTLRKSYQIASVFDYIFKVYEGIRMIRELQLNSLEYNYIKQKVSTTENEILFELGFQVYKLFDIPHRYISGLIASFNKHKQCNQIVQNSWIFLNDIYRTKASIYYPGQIIASASLFLAFQKLSISAPQKPWWILMESSISQIKHICILVNEMYEATNSNQININKISEILQTVGRKSLKVSNVLPVPYYRKINLQNQGFLFKAIEEQVEIQQNDNKNQTKNHLDKLKIQKLQENQKQMSKKQKKKHKKKHKSHKNGDRSRSKSQDNKKEKRKGKYQNDDDTPKINPKKQDLHQKNNNNESIAQENSQKKNQLIQEEEQTFIKEFEGKINKIQPDNKIIEEKVAAKKPSLDAKSMLSKISLQLKKIEVKNEVTALLHSKNQQNPHASSQRKQLNQQKEEKTFRNEQKQSQSKSQRQSQSQKSSSDQEDELLAQLIQIKKKNLKKKQETI